MKKSINIVLFVALLLGFVSCTDLLDPNLRRAESDIADDALVTLTFGIPDEVGTKALGPKPNITSMHVFAFNADGSSLVRAAKATIGGVTANYDGPENEEGVRISYWSVELPMSNAQRRLHFVANLGENFAVPTSGDEVTVMRSLIMTNGADAYWQRKILANGIRAYTYDGSGKYKYVNPRTGVEVEVNVSNITGVEHLQVNTDNTYEYDVDGMHVKVSAGDYITTEGHKSLDGKGLYASEATSGVVSRIPMIRNFTSILVSSSWTKFELKKVALINTPKAGYAVPYDLKNGRFVQQYIDATTKGDLNHSAIASTGYPATIPAEYGLETYKPNGPSVFEPASNTASHPKGEATLFMYERGLPTEYPTSLLVGGVLNVANAPKDTDGNTWFKIEITNEEGNYFPFFRNFTYLLDITEINGTNGYGSSKEAFEAGPVGDMSASTELEHELKITDNGLTLEVEYIDYTDLDGNTSQHSVTLLYKFSYNGTPLNGNVGLEVEGYSNIGAAIIDKNIESNTFTGPDNTGNWKKVTVTLDGTGETIKKSDLIVTGTVQANEVAGITKKKTLSRKVVYTILPKTPIVVSAEPLIEDTSGEETTVTINLPNNLGFSVFPITLMIEAGNNCLTSDVLTVETGTSIQNNSSKNTFFFLKTISYSDYQAVTAKDVTVTIGEDQTVTYKMKPFYCEFKTTKENGNAPTTIYVKDKGNRFDLASAPLTVETGNYFRISPKTKTVSATTTRVEFEVRTNVTGTSWSLETSSSDVIATATSYSGPQTVTVILPENDDTESEATYTVTAKLSGFSDQVFTITQGKKPLLYKFNASAFSNSTYSATSSDGKVSIALGQAQLSGTGTNAFLTLGSRTGTGWNAQTNTGSITVTPQSGFKITQIKVTYTSSTTAGYDFTGDNSVSVNTGSYNRDSNTSSTATWTGSSTGDVVFNNGYTTSGNWTNTSYNFPQISSIEVTYEAI